MGDVVGLDIVCEHEFASPPSPTYRSACLGVEETVEQCKVDDGAQAEAAPITQINRPLRAGWSAI